jgi:hypothetical protein
MLCRFHFSHPRSETVPALMSWVLPAPMLFVVTLIVLALTPT